MHRTWRRGIALAFFFFQAENGIRDVAVTGSSGVCSSDLVSDWWAKGASDVVENATRVATLEEALADVHLSVATTAVRGRHVFEQLTPHDVAQLAAEHLGDDQT